MCVNEQIITAGLLFKWHNFSLPYSRSFTNIQILPDVNLFKEKIKLMDEYKDFEIEKILKLLSDRLNIQFHLIYFDRIIHAGKEGPELFIRINSHCFIFHEHVGKIVKLPPGLGKTSRAIHKLGDMLKYKFGLENTDCDYSLGLETNLDKIEQISCCRINLWKKTVDGKSQLIKCSKKSYVKKLNLHFCSVSQKLFLIVNDKLYFRGELQKLKNYLL